MKIKPTCYLYFICLVATLGGLMFGFDIAIISGAVPFIQPYFGWNELQLGWGVSSLLVGAIIGAFGSGILTDRYGRKKILIIVALFFALSCAATALASSSFTFILARLFGGLAVGAASVLSPMYVAEVSPPNKRGMLVAIYQLTIVIGIIISYAINFWLHDVANNWRWMFATGIIPSVLFFTGLFFIPESPRWLYKAGFREKSLEVLTRIGGMALAQVEIREISESLKDNFAKVTLRELFKPSYRKVLMVGFFLAMLVQVSGINTVIDYAPKILIAAGIEIKNALLQTSLIGLVNGLFTFVAIALIDKVGRRRLYLIGSMGMAVTLVMLALSFYFNLGALLTLVCIMSFCAFFSSCIGPVFWTLVSEIFPNKIRGTAVAFASFTQWVFNFLVVLLFPYFLELVGGATTFLFLAAMSLLQWLFTYMYVPETKGKSLEEIELIWIKNETGH
ncbi:MAG: sugar porter family MFS transporter [Prolixibacteraceae bacterium]|jgi:sugar porter (SP) family MFS transporter|nr:sugar porter family MFS transporter [Prolixibacteraceae bacterium]